MPTTQVDLLSLFNAVNRTLKENKTSLNEADTYNHDHGDNMVKNFKVITKALKEKKGAPPAEQLQFASQLLNQSSKSGSAQMYSQGLAQAANQLAGQKAINAENAMTLVQALLGGQSTQPPTQPASNDMMGQLIGSLLGGNAPAGQAVPTADNQPSDALSGLMGALLGGETPGNQSGQSGGQQPDMLSGLMGSLLGGGAAEPPAQPSYGGQSGQASGQQPDMLGSLMGALMGGGAIEPQAQHSSGDQAEGGIDLNTLLGAGMAYMQASQQGAAPLEALVQAVLAGSQMNASPHHAQSGQLVASTLINTVGTLLSGKKS